jgi:hypothetical protein
MSTLPTSLRVGFLEKLRAAIGRWPHLSLCALTVLAFLPLKAALMLGRAMPDTRIWLFAAICVAAFLFFRLKTSDLPKPVSLTLRGIGLLLAIYLGLAYPSTLRGEIGDWAYFELTFYRGAGVALFCIGLWRPALMLPAFVAVRYQKLGLVRCDGIGGFIHRLHAGYRIRLFADAGCVPALAWSKAVRSLVYGFPR